MKVTGIKLVIRVFIFIVALFIVGLQGRSQHKAEALELVREMKASMNQVSSLKGDYVYKERIRGKVIDGRIKVKTTRYPRRIYLKTFVPREGAELLWKEGWNDEKVLVNPGGFPYVNLNFSPDNPKLRQNGHHRIFALGFDFFGEVVGAALKMDQVNRDTSFVLKGEVLHRGVPCYLVEYNNPRYRIMNYRISGEKSLIEVGAKFKLSDYKILELNKDLEGYDDIERDQVIKLPSSYAKKMVFYIEKESGLPLVQFIYDELGLYEQYEYRDFQVNGNIPNEEFSEDYSAYDF